MKVSPVEGRHEIPGSQWGGARQGELLHWTRDTLMAAEARRQKGATR
ncbi:MAG: hypothetical protein JO279_18080 [Verrucomicrobia bacterium]|nr:hypothetical protein [Verrucomicrobiota bacterium]